MGSKTPGGAGTEVKTVEYWKYLAVLDELHPFASLTPSSHRSEHLSGYSAVRPSDEQLEGVHTTPGWSARHPRSYFMRPPPPGLALPLLPELAPCNPSQARRFLVGLHGSPLPTPFPTPLPTPFPTPLSSSMDPGMPHPGMGSARDAPSGEESYEYAREEAPS